jgi:hypothetical protein
MARPGLEPGTPRFSAIDLTYRFALKEGRKPFYRAKNQIVGIGRFFASQRLDSDGYAWFRADSGNEKRSLPLRKTSGEGRI